MDEKNCPIPFEIDCPICLTVFYEPITLYCGHSFCKRCLITHSFESRGNLCPLCRRKVMPSLEKYEKNIQLEECIKRIKPKEYHHKMEFMKEKGVCSLDVSKRRIILKWLRSWYFALKGILMEIAKLSPVITLILGVIIFFKLKKRIHVKTINFSSENLVNKLGKLKEVLSQNEYDNPFDFQRVIISRLMRYLFTHYVKLLLN